MSLKTEKKSIFIEFWKITENRQKNLKIENLSRNQKMSMTISKNRQKCLHVEIGKILETCKQSQKFSKIQSRSLKL